MTRGAADREPPVWCIVANVVARRPFGPGGAVWRRGLRLFAPGAKVWVPDGFAGVGYDTVTVVGPTRGSRRFSIVHVRAEHLTNWRVKLVYSPAVRARIAEVCPTDGYGFSDEHGGDRTSEAYRDDLRRTAERFRRDTDRIHASWSARLDRPPNRPARLLARLARLARLPARLVGRRSTAGRTE